MQATICRCQQLVRRWPLIPSNWPTLLIYYSLRQLSSTAARQVLRSGPYKQAFPSIQRNLATSSRWSRPEPESSKPTPPATSSSAPKATAETSKLYTERQRTGGVSCCSESSIIFLLLIITQCCNSAIQLASGCRLLTHWYRSIPILPEREEEDPREEACVWHT